MHFELLENNFKILKKWEYRIRCFYSQSFNKTSFIFKNIISFAMYFVTSSIYMIVEITIPYTLGSLDLFSSKVAQ